MLRSALACSFAAALSLAPLVASAKAQTELAYRLDEIFSTTLRFVRVDRGCTITDKDPDAAFVMFECPASSDPADKKVSRGALELFRSKSGSRETIRVQLSLSDEPHGAELRWLELLERKLRDERGAPVAPPRPVPPPKPPDMGTPPPF